jgi:hypothetical protein
MDDGCNAKERESSPVGKQCPEYNNPSKCSQLDISDTVAMKRCHNRLPSAQYQGASSGCDGTLNLTKTLKSTERASFHKLDLLLSVALAASWHD